ncbi:MAG TPA: M23 family metallopeptidase [Myxococcota bacterium]
MSSHKVTDASAGVEAMILRQLLTSSGAFKMGGSGSGSHVAEDMFVSTLADVIAKQHPLHLEHLGQEGGQAGAQAAMMHAPHAHSDGPLTATELAHEIVGNKGHVTSTFGARTDPITHKQDFHHAIDVAAPLGTPIDAARSGVVKFAGEQGGYGLVVEIDHGNGMTSKYAHASQLLVKAGDHVREGEPVARVGQTGRATGPHVHIEVEVNGKRVDPVSALHSGSERSDIPSGDAFPGSRT